MPGAAGAGGFGAGLAKGLASVFLSKRQKDQEDAIRQESQQAQLKLGMLPYLLENAQDPNQVIGALGLDLTGGVKPGKGEINPNDLLAQVIGPALQAPTAGAVAGDVKRDVMATGEGLIPSSTIASPATPKFAGTGQTPAAVAATPGQPAAPAIANGPFAGISLMTPEQRTARKVSEATAVETGKINAQNDAKLALAQRLRAADPSMSVEDSLIAVGLKVPRDKFAAVPDTAAGILDTSTGKVTPLEGGTTGAGSLRRLTGPLGERARELKATNPQLSDADAMAQAAGQLKEEREADVAAKRASQESILANRQIQQTLLKLQEAQGGITPNNAAGLTSQLRRDWTKAIEPFKQRKTYVAKLENTITPDANGQTMIQRDRNAATQVIINSFNRLIEEGNTVREGEYARSEELAPYLTRIEAALNKLTQGGGKLTDEQLTSIAQEGINIARITGAVHEAGLADLRQAMTTQLGRYNLPPEDVFANSSIGAPKFTATLNGKPFTFPTQAALDLFKRKFPDAK